ncbi:MAG: hypothetical protein ACJ8G1_20350 [Vitreoscilla sp.]
MTQPSAKQIEQLCDDWCTASTPPGGGLQIGSETEKFRLRANGVVFHELDFASLCAAVIGLSKALLRPGLNTIVDFDHFTLWSWCAELILASRPSVFAQAQHEIKATYETAIHAALASCTKPPASKDEWREQGRIRDLQPHHAKQLLSSSSSILAYISFPLLEAVLKRACAAYVAFDGQVVATFSVPSRSGNVRTYDPNGSYRDQQCSSLRDLLFLHRTSVADSKQKLLLDRFRLHLGSLDTSGDPFDVLYRWRNQSLHGSTSFETIGGTVLGYCLLISLFELEPDFDARRTKAIEHCRWEAQSSHRSPWSFYPPY